MSELIMSTNIFVNALELLVSITYKIFLSCQITKIDYFQNKP